ncbi:hypothetical protein RF11_10109 [Thelohanellus kitauei]|uniref:Uncharacterized protein n=1 Tax=Thelohanellus kitauei TaxID=669202 RepID=A0A0C2MY93_THEKT|nr:hypothetical protein RF11_08541 [Thelohanellus kitauei]KII72306.1 hypothetical protein RF11_10109 [Thelohanellus kitauei]
MLNNTITLKQRTNPYGLEPLKKHFQSPPHYHKCGHNLYDCIQPLLQQLRAFRLTHLGFARFLSVKQKYPNPIIGIPIIPDFGIDEDIHDFKYYQRERIIDGLNTWIKKKTKTNIEN